MISESFFVCFLSKETHVQQDLLNWPKSQQSHLWRYKIYISINADLWNSSFQKSLKKCITFHKKNVSSTMFWTLKWIVRVSWAPNLCILVWFLKDHVIAENSAFVIIGINSLLKYIHLYNKELFLYNKQTVVRL